MKRYIIAAAAGYAAGWISGYTRGHLDRHRTVTAAPAPPAPPDPRPPAVDYILQTVKFNELRTRVLQHVVEWSNVGVTVPGTRYALGTVEANPDGTSSLTAASLIRAHLQRLVELDLAVASYEDDGDGRRPVIVYHATDLGRDVAKALQKIPPANSGKAAAATTDRG